MVNISGDDWSGTILGSAVQPPGVIRIGLAWAQPLAEDGALVEISFEVVGSLQNPAEVSFATARLNEKAVPATLKNGAVRDTSVSIRPRSAFSASHGLIFHPKVLSWILDRSVGPALPAA